MMTSNAKVNKAKMALLSMQRYPWEQGIAIQAFLECGDDDIVIQLAHEAVYRSIEDGRVAIIGSPDATTDPCVAGPGLIRAVEWTGDEKLNKGLEGLKKWTLEKAPRNNQGILYHLEKKPEFWVDSMYMLPPFLVEIGHKEEAMKQLDGYWYALYNEEKQLMSHMWDDNKQAFVREDFWGVGNGWAIAALVRMIGLYDDESIVKEGLIRRAKLLIDGLLPYMREDGLFHDVVDDDRTFVEVNLTQMLAYALFRGIRQGWLAPDMESIAIKLRRAANEQVDAYGFVRNVCGAPDFNKPGIAPEGQAFYIMMEAAADHYYK